MGEGVLRNGKDNWYLYGHARDGSLRIHKTSEARQKEWEKCNENAGG